MKKILNIVILDQVFVLDNRPVKKDDYVYVRRHNSVHWVNKEKAYCPFEYEEITANTDNFKYVLATSSDSLALPRIDENLCEIIRHEFKNGNLLRLVVEFDENNQPVVVPSKDCHFGKLVCDIVDARDLYTFADVCILFHLGKKKLISDNHMLNYISTL